jgi:hypothetical protein
MPLRSPWRSRGQGEGEYDCGFHSIFFIGMVAYLPLVLPLSDLRVEFGTGEKR